MVDYNEQSIKFGFLSIDEMLNAVKSGELKAYDVCFSKNTHEIFLIKEDLEPLPLKNRMKIYNSIEEANEEINNDISSYVGELVSILNGNKYTAYIINDNNGVLEVEPVSEQGQAEIIHRIVNEELDKRTQETYIFYGGSAEEVIDFE